jgi:hypothetical protein
MNSESNGIFPEWVDDKDIINQVLNAIIEGYGRLHYSFIVNPNHKLETQQRMKLILERMEKEKLLLHPIKENDYLEMDVMGGWAAKIGYRRYSKVKRWIALRNKLRSIYNVFFVLAVIVLIGILAYLIFSHIKRA